MNLSAFRTACANELGLDNDPTTEQPTIDAAVNAGVQRVLEDTMCYVTEIDFTPFDGTSLDYELYASVLEIIDMTITSAGTVYPLYRISVPSIIEKRRVGAPTGSPVQFFALAGANRLMFYPAPGVSDVLKTIVIPIPTALSASGDDPSATANGGVPAILHQAIKYWAFAELASGDDDASSQQGQRYRNDYDSEIVRYKKIIRRRAGIRLPRAEVNTKGVGGTRFHDPSTYFSGMS